MLQRNAVVYGGCGLEDVGITVHGGGPKMLRFVKMYSDLLRICIDCMATVFGALERKRGNGMANRK